MLLISWILFWVVDLRLLNNLCWTTSELFQPYSSNVNISFHIWNFAFILLEDLSTQSLSEYEGVRGVELWWAAPLQLWSLISNPPKLTQARFRLKKKMYFCIIILSMEEMRLVYGGTPRIKPSTKCFLEKYSQLVVERYKKTVYLGMRAGSLHLIMSHPWIYRPTFQHAQMLVPWPN